ncbi:hypothetical protein L873DRAFT_1804508 [Choiromyces venosus 120613-1]|uniref:Secreted protein n=1 Tax=Choiromyces venosus 120613-1 TaxID=1336337 RepID=A0A3N4JRG8_9PEZI|nr:hypothetical protein L873DRAFT_1804508 [Choiromyces venosus 120613-1]
MGWAGLWWAQPMSLWARPGFGPPTASTEYKHFYHTRRVDETPRPSTVQHCTRTANNTRDVRGTPLHKPVHSHFTQLSTTTPTTPIRWKQTPHTRQANTNLSTTSTSTCVHTTVLTHPGTESTWKKKKKKKILSTT